MGEVTLDVHHDFAISQAIREIRSTTGDKVSVFKKAKSLNKFGRNASVGTSFATVSEFQGSETNETFVSTNLIDAAVSSSASDTQTITIEGHTIDGEGNLTFVVQNVTLTGQTKAPLTTPLARATRAYIASSGTFDSPQADAVGVISIYDDTDGETSGVPDTAAATKILIPAGETQSQKCATTLSSQDYYILTGFSAAVSNAGGSAARVTFRIERRDVKNGGVWRPTGRQIVVRVDANGVFRPFLPYIWIAKNHDIRVRAKANANTCAVEAEFAGYLAKVEE